MTAAVNWLIEGLGALLVMVISLLPDTPFEKPSTPPDAVDLGYITWLIPFPTMFAHLIGLVGAVLIYYSIRVMARWVKLARG